MSEVSTSHQRISGCSPYETRIGFSRAVRVGNQVFVSGTAPIDPDGSTACRGDAYGQTTRCLEIIREALESAGARMEDVVRVRLYISDRRYSEQICEAYREVLGEVRPAATMIVTKLLEDDWAVELEVDAVIGTA